MNQPGGDHPMCTNKTTDTRAGRSLPIEQWPASDRIAWTRACTPNIRLQRGGAGSHLKLVSKTDYARRYGAFLHFLQCHGRLDLSCPLAPT